eukprot:NODE_7597_length_1564_cov_17.383438.p1 GENE.NODE_7597_length_1564_cov_17.383438~~NODE_7597_length_1564_cov_17.383438.p1  ORF type:complete len:304 (-),score=72.55 NODE_7597_length_1564_cov_17.383438:540-1451(-)
MLRCCESPQTSDTQTIDVDPEDAFNFTDPRTEKPRTSPQWEEEAEPEPPTAGSSGVLSAPKDSPEDTPEEAPCEPPMDELEERELELTPEQPMEPPEEPREALEPVATDPELVPNHMASGNIYEAELEVGMDDIGIDFIITTRNTSDDASAMRMLAVKSVRDKTHAAKWNKTCAPGCRIEVHDEVVSINGHSGDPAMFIEQMQSEPNLRFVMRRPGRRMVTLTGTKGHMGMAMLKPEGRIGPLIVSCIMEGVVMNWNEAHPDQAVHVGDLVVQVNGISAPKERMLKQLFTDDHIDMEVLHFAR